MSLYGTKATSKTPGPKPVWPCYFVSVCAIVLALGASVVYWPKDIPEFGELTKTGGKMRTLVIRDDLSNSTAGSMLPIFTSVYMRFKDIDGEFRYPWTFPKYAKVRNDTAVNVEIWVEQTALGRDDAPLIWGLVESNPYKKENEQTVILYDELIEGQKQNGLILIKVTLSLVVAAIAFWLLGFGIGRWNRKKFPDRYP